MDENAEITAEVIEDVIDDVIADVPAVEEDSLVEDVSIDGMCGVY